MCTFELRGEHELGLTLQTEGARTLGPNEGERSIFDSTQPFVIVHVELFEKPM